MIPPTLAISAASSALGLISSVASQRHQHTGGSEQHERHRQTRRQPPPIKGKENDVVNQAEFMKLLIAQLRTRTR